MINRLQRFYANWRYRKTMRLIRLHAGALNFPLDHLTDEEIETGIYRVASIAAEGFGITAAEATKALWLVGQWEYEAMNQEPHGGRREANTLFLDPEDGEPSGDASTWIRIPLPEDGTPNTSH